MLNGVIVVVNVFVLVNGNEGFDAPKLSDGIKLDAVVVTVAGFDTGVDNAKLNPDDNVVGCVAVVLVDDMTFPIAVVANVVVVALFVVNENEDGTDVPKLNPVEAEVVAVPSKVPNAGGATEVVGNVNDDEPPIDEVVKLNPVLGNDVVVFNVKLNKVPPDDADVVAAFVVEVLAIGVPN